MGVESVLSGGWEFLVGVVVGMVLSYIATEIRLSHSRREDFNRVVDEVIEKVKRTTK